MPNDKQARYLRTVELFRVRIEAYEQLAADVFSAEEAEYWQREAEDVARQLTTYQEHHSAKPKQ